MSHSSAKLFILFLLLAPFARAETQPETPESFLAHCQNFLSKVHSKGWENIGGVKLKDFLEALKQEKSLTIRSVELGTEQLGKSFGSTANVVFDPATNLTTVTLNPAWYQMPEEYREYLCVHEMAARNGIFDLNYNFLSQLWAVKDFSATDLNLGSDVLAQYVLKHLSAVLVGSLPELPFMNSENGGGTLVGGGGDQRSVYVKIYLLNILRQAAQSKSLNTATLAKLTPAIFECSFDVVDHLDEYLMFMKPDSIALIGSDATDAVVPYFDHASNSGGYYVDSVFAQKAVSPSEFSSVISLLKFVLKNPVACLR